MREMGDNIIIQSYKFKDSLINLSRKKGVVLTAKVIFSICVFKYVTAFVSLKSFLFVSH